MSLSAGQNLGSYEILDLLGEGGMGRVYRARDTKLGREVAIKTLADELTRDEARLHRFGREAQLLASLNHPNIAAIYGFEEDGGLRFLVLELVPGETLAGRLSRGRLPVRDALELALQIADALDAAHEKGVIHRDLKPANVKITSEGKIKVLDFGLAKAFTEESASPEVSNSPTLSAASTRAGVILGTAAYMSPEQARGKTLDKRTDIFSFGVVVYEMLSGRPLFGGEEVSDILASVLKTEPDWTALPPDTPSKARDLLRRCLQKDPKRRQRDMGDVRLEIEEALGRPEPPAPVERRGRTWVVLAVVALASSLLGGALFWSLKPEPPRAVTRFAMALPKGESFSFTGRRVVAMSPSGSHVAYVANSRLNLRALDQMETKPLPGTDAPRSPVFSPDGKWIAFWASGAMMKVAVTGGAPVTICPAPEIPYGVSWGPDADIVFGQGREGIWRVSPDGGEPEVLVRVDEGQLVDGPEILPGGKTLLFTLASGSEWDSADIVAQSLTNGARRILVRGGSDARYVPTGHLVYALGGTLLAVPFDLESLETRGGPVPVIEGVLRAMPPNTGTAHFTFSQDGTLAYVPGRGDESVTLVVVDRTGRVQSSVENRGFLQEPRFSPDGGRIAALVSEGGVTDVWILDLARNTLARLTAEGVEDGLLWSPDGEWLVFSSERGASGLDLKRKRADFSSASELLLERKNDQWPAAWSRDGKWLVFRDSSLGESRLGVLPLEGGGEPALLFESAEGGLSASFSPDGRFLAYTSPESGRNEIYVRPFPGPGRRWPISTNGAGYPVWSGDGREIFYREGQKIMAVKVATLPDFEAFEPVPLFEDAYVVQGPWRQWDVSPDGQRFVFNRADTSGAEGPRIHVVLNWFDELRKLAPTEP